MALVIDIKGVCNAGATPQTEKYPVMTESEKMLAMVKIAGLEQANPSPRTDSSPPDNPSAFFNDLLKRFSGTASFFLCYYLGFDLDASSIGGFGFGQRTSLFWVTIAPLTT
jgi:hypothetical protein